MIHWIQPVRGGPVIYNVATKRFSLWVQIELALRAEFCPGETYECNLVEFYEKQWSPKVEVQCPEWLTCRSWYLPTCYLSTAALSQDCLVHRCCESFRLSLLSQTACSHSTARSLDCCCWDYWHGLENVEAGTGTATISFLATCFCIGCSYRPLLLLSPLTLCVTQGSAAAPFCPGHPLALIPDSLRLLPPLGSVLVAHCHTASAGLSIHQTPVLLAPFSFQHLLFRPLANLNECDNFMRDEKNNL